MGAPHNTARYGEVWPRHKIMIVARELERLRTLIVLSGGWAWHFMSVEDHAEYKHAHDHKDVDLFVHPNEATMLIRTLQAMEYVRVSTRYDTGKKDFQRYEAVAAPKSEAPFKITLEQFVSLLCIARLPPLFVTVLVFLLFVWVRGCRHQSDGLSAGIKPVHLASEESNEILHRDRRYALRLAD